MVAHFRLLRTRRPPPDRVCCRDRGIRAAQIRRVCLQWRTRVVNELYLPGIFPGGALAHGEIPDAPALDDRAGRGAGVAGVLALAAEERSSGLKNRRERVGMIGGPVPRKKA